MAFYSPMKSTGAPIARGARDDERNPMHHEHGVHGANPTRIALRATLVANAALFAVVALLVAIAASQGAGA